jgi:spermidine/putrescine transport system substrate-binding protein
VPNKAAMDGLDPALLKQYPNLAITPAELLKFEQMRDLGEAQKLWSKTVTEITSSN